MLSLFQSTEDIQGVEHHTVQGVVNGLAESGTGYGMKDMDIFLCPTLQEPPQHDYLN
jgi:hypothetical protein